MGFILIYGIQCLKFTFPVLPSTKLSGLLYIQDLDTAQKVGWFGLAETIWQDASELQVPDVLLKNLH